MIPYPVEGGHQKVAFTATSAAIANAVGTQIRRVAVYSTTDCYIRFEKSPTATTSDFFLPGSMVVMLSIRPGQKVAAVQDATAGTLHVSEIDY